jgi:hypothetical protein
MVGKMWLLKLLFLGLVFSYDWQGAKQAGNGSITG